MRERPEYEVNFDDKSNISWKAVVIPIVLIFFVLLVIFFSNVPLPSFDAMPGNLTLDYKYELKEIKGVECIFLKQGNEYIGIDCNDNKMGMWFRE